MPDLTFWGEPPDNILIFSPGVSHVHHFIKSFPWGTMSDKTGTAPNEAGHVHEVGDGVFSGRAIENEYGTHYHVIGTEHLVP